MKILTITILFLLSIGCGNIKTIPDFPKIYRTYYRFIPADLMQCPSGGSVLISGLDSNASDALDDSEITDITPICNGINGVNALVEVVNVSSCEAGGYTILTGQDLNADSFLNPTEVKSSVEVCNGLDAKQSSVELIDPCGDKLGIYDEIILRLENGTLLSSFSDNTSGKNTRFSVLTEGRYMTSDGSKCFFSVDINGNIINEHY